jgi:hypothetical protein
VEGIIEVRQPLIWLWRRLNGPSKVPGAILTAAGRLSGVNRTWLKLATTSESDPTRRNRVDSILGNCLFGLQMRASCDWPNLKALDGGIG